MKGFAMKAVKAALATTAVLVAVDYGAAKLPAGIAVAGRDLRPYVVGTGVLLVLMHLPGKAAPVKAS